MSRVIFFESRFFYVLPETNKCTRHSSSVAPLLRFHIIYPYSIFLAKEKKNETHTKRYWLNLHNLEHF